MSSLLIRCVGVLVIASMLLFPAGALAAPDGSGETVHIVQWGETLSLIASRYGVTVEAIMAANGLDDPDFVYVGQRLVIPMPHHGFDAPGMGGWGPDAGSGTCNYYTVRLGDTLTGIAYRYGTTANALMQANSLPGDFIYEGQKLCVPSGGEMPSMSPGYATSTYYTVRAGDTLAGIALRYGVSQAAMVQANNLSNPSFIYVGQSLVIPGARSGEAMPSRPMTGMAPTSPAGRAPMGPDGRPRAPYGDMGAMDGRGQPVEPGMAPAPPPGYQPPQGAPGEGAPAPPPEYQPYPAVVAGEPVIVRASEMWTGSQIAHNADPDEITTLLVLVEEGNVGLDIMIRSRDGFVARGVTGVYYEYSWLPNFAFRGIPGGEYEIWVEGQPTKTIKATVDPGWRATVDMKFKLVSGDPVVTPGGWIAEVIDNTSGSKPIGAFSILVVRTGAIGNKVRVTAPGGYEGICITGTKPEHGVGACDVGGLNAGTYQVILDGTDAAVELYLDGVGTATVEFRPAW